MVINEFFRAAKGINSRYIINATTIALAILVFILTGVMAWHAYGRYQAAERVVQANQIVDRLLVASGVHAMERGLTASALGSTEILQDNLKQQLTGLRLRGDNLWREALGLARPLFGTLSSDLAFNNSLDHSIQQYSTLQMMRQRVDQSLATGKRDVVVTDWIDATTDFISANARLRDVAFSVAENISNETLYLDINMSRQTWLIAEYAGLERGMLVYYLGRQSPVPDRQLDKLKAYHGVVDRNVDELLTQSRLNKTDPRIAQAIEVMEHRFLVRFQEIRKKIYSATVDGNYPISASEWWLQATDAIDSVLTVSAVVSTVTSERARRLAKQSLNQLAGFIALVAITVVFVLLSMNRVRKTANALLREKEVAEVTLHSIGDAVIKTDADANVEYMNPLAEELTGWSTEEAAGKPLNQVFNIVNGFNHEPQTNPVEQCLQKGTVVGLANNTVLISRNDKEYVIEDSAAPIHDAKGQIIGAVMVFYDVTAMRSNVPHLLSYHATHDALTGLVNRREFQRRLAEALAQAKGSDYQHALCYLDLDQFKIINDTCGHAVGDRLLRQLTQLLHLHVRESDTLARLGGDEFGMLLHNCSLDRAQNIAQKLCDTVREFRFAWGDQVFELGVSVGLVPITGSSNDPQEILSEADAACFTAKEKGRNRIQVFEHGDVELARRHGEMQWVSRLNQAIKEDRFELYCQPIASMSNGDEKRCEILLRLRDEDDKLVLPGEFIPAAERYNLMVNIDKWVIANALARIGQYRAENKGANGRIWSINISGASLGDESLLLYLTRQIDLHNVPAESLCFEITETAAVENIESARNLIETLKDAGCQFALDDFGSGLSSFTYLKNLPVDYVKIDGAFIKGIVSNSLDYALVRSINDIGHAIGTRTIAEFVESREIMEKVKEIGIDYAQGFFVATPIPMSDCCEKGWCH